MERLAIDVDAVDVDGAPWEKRLSASIDLLFELLKIDSPSGDEGPMADWVTAWIQANCAEARVARMGDSLIAIRGEAPATAIFAHLDTTGFTLGYESRLISIGSPAPEDGTPVREATPNGRRGVVRECEDVWEVADVDGVAAPGTRWVYAAEPFQSGDEIVSPYLDNRGGMWAALNALTRCPSIAVALTTGEEHSGQGAFVCARYLFENYAVDQALISDITWDTEHVHCGKGVAISLRDRMVPRQRFLDRVLSLAEVSGLPFQREIESSGGSDGAYLQRSGFPIDWVFVGAPEKHPHTDHEVVNVRDLRVMADMLVALVEGLSE